MAFARNAGFTSAIATNPADTAAGYLTPTRYNLPFVVSGADVGGIPYCPTATTEATSANLTYSEAVGNRLQIGSGSTGIVIGTSVTGTPSAGIPWIISDGGDNWTLKNRYGSFIIGLGGSGDPSLSPSGSTIPLSISPGGNLLAKFGGAAGTGLAITAGTATGAGIAAFDITRTNNNAAVDTGVKWTFTDTSSAAGFLPFQILAGGSGTTSIFQVDKGGGVLTQGVIRSQANFVSDDYFLSSTGKLYLRDTTTAFINFGSADDASINRPSAGLLQIGTGGAGSFAGSLKAAVYQGMMGTGAGIGNMVSTATVNTTAVASTGAGPDILQTYDLPLNSFSAAGKGVHITVWGTSANTAEAKTIILYFGSTAILTNALTASIAGVWRIEADVYSTGTDAQQYVAQLVTTGTAGVALNDVEQGTSAQDDGAAITIKCTGTIGAPSTAAGLVQEGMTVRFIN